MARKYSKSRWNIRDERNVAPPDEAYVVLWAERLYNYKICIRTKGRRRIV